jgi:hypothetical protein
MQTALVIAVRVSDHPTPGTGEIPGTCGGCQANVWMPSTTQEAIDLGMETLVACTACYREAVSDLR